MFSYLNKYLIPRLANVCPSNRFHITAVHTEPHDELLKWVVAKRIETFLSLD